MSPEGVWFLTRLEGSKRRAYRDSADLWTIGVGHLLTKDELSSGKVRIGAEDVKWRNTLTEEQVKLLLKQDLGRTERVVTRDVGPPLQVNEFDALVCFVFNVGVGAFRGSTLLKRLNGGRKEDVPSEMMRWVFAAGKRVLVRRRQHEVDLWNTGNYQVR